MPPRQVGPQTQIISGRIPAPRPQFANVLAELKSLGERSGSALSDLYARAAGSFLERLEQVEDANAERQYLKRAKRAAPHSSAPASALPIASKTSTATKTGA